MCDISLGEKLVHCSNRDRTPFNTHFFFPNNNNYYYYHDHYEDRNNIGKIRSRCGATKRKDHWNSQARRREGKNKNFLGFLCEHPPRMATWKRRNVSSPAVSFSRGKQQIFPYSRGIWIDYPPPLSFPPFLWQRSRRRSTYVVSFEQHKELEE